VLLHQHRTLILIALAACGDNTCPQRSSDSTCLVTRIDGNESLGQLGFRFSEPFDLDGDGVGEVVAGARYESTAGAWTGGEQIARWSGQPESLFGNAVVATPDLDGDGEGDVVVSEPQAVLADGLHGIVTAFKLDGTQLWQIVGGLGQSFGWYVTRAGDQTGDGFEDLWIGAPSSIGGFVYLASGIDGSIVLSLAGPRDAGQFGWHIAPLGDIDGDGHNDLAIGAPAATVGGSYKGQLHVISGTGLPIFTLTGEFPDHQFGIMATGLDDIDGDGIPDLAVSAPGGEIETAPGGSEIQLVSGRTGDRLRLLTSPTDGELYGRMLTLLDDLDGDGLRDLAIGAPWANGKAGRIEVRSARTNSVLVTIDGDEPESWLGWHITRSGLATNGPGFVVSRLHDNDERGALEIHEVR
jgi:hypothetical protein